MKKLISMFLVITLNLGILPKTVALASEIEPEIERETIQQVLEQYFSELFGVLLDDTKNFSYDDFASTNGYIIGRGLVSRRYGARVLFGGIVKAELEEVSIDDINKIEDGLEVMAYVRFSYSFGRDPEDLFGEGDLFRIFIVSDANGYKVRDLDCNSEYQTMAKETLAVLNTPNIESNYEAVDAYFEEKDKNADSMLDWNKEDFAIPEEEEEEAAPRAGISFNTRKAKYWGYRLGEQRENYIFKRLKEDCTNFVSQCVWAGYGGTDGYNIPKEPDDTDPTCIALKQRVKSDYRMTGEWYGRNYDSNAGDPPAKWCGVVEFYDYVTTNTGNGPRATGYNNNKPYSSLSTKIKMGDVLQFYNNVAKRYRHSAIVVTQKTHTVGYSSKIKIAQHSVDKKAKPLDEALDSYYGTATKVRLLRFKPATF